MDLHHRPETINYINSKNFQLSNKFCEYFQTPTIGRISFNSIESNKKWYGYYAHLLKLYSNSVSVKNVTAFQIWNYSVIFYCLLLIVISCLSATAEAQSPELLQRQYGSLKYADSKISLSSHVNRFPQCKIQCRSTKKRQFCASDGKTYSSKCELRKAVKCGKKSIHVVSKGRCSESSGERGLKSNRDNKKNGGRDKNVPKTNCTVERDNLIAANKQNTYIPSCYPNGSYTPVQCYKTSANSGYCWCATSDGKPIPQTSVKEAIPDCSKGVAKPSIKKRRGASKKKCSRSDRSDFTRNLVEEFAKDFSRTSMAREQEQGNEYVDVIGWKFDQLDKDQDGLLKYNELKFLKRMVRKLVKPRSCSKRFPNFCEESKEKPLVISKKEWSKCLSDGAINDKTGSPIRDKFDGVEKPGGGGARGGSLSARKGHGTNLKPAIKYIAGGTAPNPTSPSTQTPQDSHKSEMSFLALLVASDEKKKIGRSKNVMNGNSAVSSNRDSIKNIVPIKNCSLERSRVLATAGKETSGIYIPTCHPNGSYTEVQCFNELKQGYDNKDNYCWCVSAEGEPVPNTSVKEAIPDCAKDKPSVGPSLNSKQLGSRINIKPSDDMPETLPNSDIDCFEDRRQEEENEKLNPDAQIFVPECVEGGLYKKHQCHKSTGYCWCVDEITGVPILGYSTRHTVPDCSKAKPERDLKGQGHDGELMKFPSCPYPQRRQYLTLILDTLSAEMMKYAEQNPHKEIEMDPNHTFEETAVRWKFRILDKNRNEQLDRKETKDLKEQLKNDVQSHGETKLRKCARNFLRYCDENSNGKISINEWAQCLKINDNTKHETENGSTRTGINPLTQFLKS